jgi:hypothetical protein
MQIIDEIDGALGGVEGKGAIDALLKIVCHNFNNLGYDVILILLNPNIFATLNHPCTNFIWHQAYSDMKEKENMAENGQVRQVSKKRASSGTLSRPVSVTISDPIQAM